MDLRLKKRIESAAWDCTVGAGIDPDEATEPTAAHLAYLHGELGREPTPEELTYFIVRWHQGVREVAQP